MHCRRLNLFNYFLPLYEMGRGDDEYLLLSLLYDEYLLLSLLYDEYLLLSLLFILDTETAS